MADPTNPFPDSLKLGIAPAGDDVADDLWNWMVCKEQQERMQSLLEEQDDE